VNEVFGDTYYFLALLAQDDEGHNAAIAASRSLTARVVTTAWVLVEVADALSGAATRLKCAGIIEDLERKPMFLVLPGSLESFRAGLRLYRSRPDKDWSLTDCISFAVMKERGIAEALTGDHHFEQAGFTALLK
jgi:predicted nucleic acid-binding protein